MGRTSDARERLMQAAYPLFYTRGYNAVGIQEICAAADVKKGSFYYFFASKRDLALAIIDDLWRAYRDGPLTYAFAIELPIKDKFYRYFQMTYEIEKARQFPVRGCVFGNFAVEMSVQDEVIQNKMQEVFQEWRGVFERVLQQAVEAGELQPLNVKTTAQAILALYQGTAVLGKTYDDVEYLDRMSAMVKQLIE